MINNQKISKILNIFLLTVGTIISTLALELFLIPNTILDGGITGISIIIYKLTNIPLSILVVTFNLPFIYIGYRHLGIDFFYRTVYSMLIFSLSLTVFAFLTPFTEEILLATVFGGALLGVGVGLVIRSGGCLDGTESVAMVISKRTNLSVGQIVLIFNLIIYTTAGFIFGFDRAMYSLLTYFITYKVIDLISEGLEQTKAAMIITEKSNSLANEIHNRLGRTCTIIKGRGLISGEKEILYCVLTRIEIFELKKIINELDESAFVTISDITDIIGNHIKSNNQEEVL